MPEGEELLQNAWVRTLTTGMPIHSALLREYLIAKRYVSRNINSGEVATLETYLNAPTIPLNATIEGRDGDQLTIAETIADSRPSNEFAKVEATEVINAVIEDCQTEREKETVVAVMMTENHNQAAKLLGIQQVQIERTLEKVRKRTKLRFEDLVW